MIIERRKDELFRLQIRKILFYFLVFGFFGWFFETAYVWIRFGRFTYRGYFFMQHPLEYYFTFLKDIPFISKVPLVWGMPFIEMYGLGGVIVMAFCGHLKDRPMRLFFTGMTLMTLFELIGSYVCTELLGVRYWNYSNDFMNFEGRICLLSSIAWGLLTVFGVSIIKPRIDESYDKVQGRENLQRKITFLVSYAVLCAVIKYLLAPSITAWILN